jgi:Uma2 family endonuclease
LSSSPLELTTVIIEVLSEDTEAYDRGGTFAGYRQAETLQEYLLVAQNRPRIEHYIRQPDGRRLLSESVDLKGAIHLPSLGADLALSEVYDGVSFEAETEAGQ